MMAQLAAIVYHFVKDYAERMEKYHRKSTDFAVHDYSTLFNIHANNQWTIVSQ